MKKEKCYTVEFTEEELRLIMEVFKRMEHRSFVKWHDLWPPRGEKPSKECTKQFHMLSRLEEIKDKAATPLGLSVRKDLWDF